MALQSRAETAGSPDPCGRRVAMAPNSGIYRWHVGLILGIVAVVASRRS